MGFGERQIRLLRARLSPKSIREREADGKIIRYLEGAYVVGEANRIFGFAAWSREIIEAKCVFTKQLGDRYSAAYVTRVRITVAAGERSIIREGSGAGEATTDSPGSAHERAAKAAETDATKRALVTFGNRFGLSLYRQKQDHASDGFGSANGKAKPPSRAENLETATGDGGPARQAAASIDIPTGRIEKSTLTFGEPQRLRNKAHLRYVASQPCAVCGRGRSQAHHVTFAQPRALGRKVSDEFTVPLCIEHHRELHESGNEREWWRTKQIDPTSLSRDLWTRSASSSVLTSA